jgi:2-dehydro-3-deoxyphosphogluconate aldolase / (4S)-4-hydroxy-2-oxoglutarate aldolase
VTAPDILVGAGTVLTAEQVKRSIEAGAKFVVSPGLSLPVVEYCLEHGVPVMPGGCSPTDIGTAVGYGLKVLKFFPAEAMGGLNTLKAMSAPFGGVQFVPTCGVSTQNLCDYLAFPKVLACGGTWIAKPELVRGGDFGSIARITREAVGAMLGFRLDHVGVRPPSSDASDTTASVLHAMLGVPSSAETALRVVDDICHGTNSYVALKTTSIRRALAYFERRGIRTPAGEQTVGKEVCLDVEIAGLALKLVEKSGN